MDLSVLKTLKAKPLYYSHVSIAERSRDRGDVSTFLCPSSIIFEASRLKRRAIANRGSYQDRCPTKGASTSFDATWKCWRRHRASTSPKGRSESAGPISQSSILENALKSFRKSRTKPGFPAIESAIT